MSSAKSEPDILPGIEEFKDISASIISDEEAAAKAKAERERLAAEEAKAKADEEAVIEDEFPIPSLPQGEVEKDDYFNELETLDI